MTRPQPADRKDQLLEHAIDLVSESGLSALTMKKVAERVGFTEAAAYRYFPTKRALILALTDRVRGAFLETVRTIAARNDLSREVRLERIVRMHVDLVLRTEGLPILLLAQASATGDRALLARMRAGLDEYLGVLESLLERGTGRDDFPSAHARALLLFAMPAVLAIRRRLGSSRDAETEIPERLLPFVIRTMISSEPVRGDARKGSVP